MDAHTATSVAIFSSKLLGIIVWAMASTPGPSNVAMVDSTGREPSRDLMVKVMFDERDRFDEGKRVGACILTIEWFDQNLEKMMRQYG